MIYALFFVLGIRKKGRERKQAKKNSAGENGLRVGVTE